MKDRDSADQSHHDAGPPLLDLDYLAELEDESGHDAAFLAEYADLLAQVLTEELPLMRRAVAQGDGKALFYHAHRLKGSAANLGCLYLRHTCDQVEEAGLSDPNLDRLERIGQRSLAALQQRWPPPADS